LAKKACELIQNPGKVRTPDDPIALNWEFLLGDEIEMVKSLLAGQYNQILAYAVPRVVIALGIQIKRMAAVCDFGDKFR